MVVKEGPKVNEAWVKGLMEERTAAKKAKEWARADAIRKELDEAGIVVTDTPQGPVWAVRA